MHGAASVAAGHILAQESSQTQRQLQQPRPEDGPDAAGLDVPFAASARDSFICGMAASAPPATTRLPERLERIPRGLAGLRRNQMLLLVRDKTLEVHQLISHPYSTVPPMPLCKQGQSVHAAPPS
ncbi:hypothetical protein TgHK011_008161 [Trichoderma gracile]|nr:hypothetical protein TgHK011_008161 [Trichoderma gracile]